MKHQPTESDTEIVAKKSKKGWIKWLSITGIGTIASLLLAAPVIKGGLIYSYDFLTAPSQIHQLQTQMDAMRTHENENEIENAKQWARANERFDNIEKLLTRVLDNQERASQYNPRFNNKP